MRKLRDILRLRLNAGLSVRQIKASLRLSVGGVQRVTSAAEALGLDWMAVEQLDDQQLARLFYPRADTTSDRLQMPDFAAIHKELRRKGMTKLLLWEEYSEQYPNRSYSYAQFCHHYKQWAKRQKRSMRQVHKAGEKLFVDYAGQTVPIVGEGGEVRFAQIFVAVLGASNYTYCEATWTQTLRDWLNSHARAFTFFGGVPAMVIPDNLKSGVTTACRYEPEVNDSYLQLGAHYGTAILPARPRKPQDKAKAEVGVQLVERWILARLRHHTFFSLAELNHCIKALLTELNQRPFRRMEGTRQQWFESIDRPELKSLPRQPYEYTHVKEARVNIDYHIEYDGHLYSVPHQLVGEKIDVHARDYRIEMVFHNRCVASHARSYRPGMTTVATHMPVRHEKHHRWNATRLKQWAADLGDDVLRWVEALIASKDHEEQAYRACLGLLNLSKKYPAERLNAACGRAHHHHLFLLKNVTSILQSNQDQLPLSTAQTPVAALPQSHENIRGPKSFH